MTRLYCPDGTLAWCWVCWRVSGWTRYDAGEPVYQCRCGTVAPDIFRKATERVRDGEVAPKIDMTDWPASEPA